MKFNRTLVLVVSSILLFSACSSDSDDTVSAIKGNSNPLLAYVPADTAYVMADLESVPLETIDA